MDITKLSACEMKEKILNKEISSRELVEAHLKKIEENDPKINAFISINKDEALKQADSVDEKIKNGEEIGALAGLPIAIKDNIVTKGLRTTCGSKMLEDFISPYDATVIEKIKKEDGIIIGKTNMDEFAMGGSGETSYFGPTRNPINTDFVPGGSSSGSAAAVAGNMVPLALGSDTGGSVRQPASFCGIVGIKPTYGMVSRYGLVPMANSLDQVGAFGRNVEDTMLLLNSITGYDKNDSTSSKKSDMGIVLENFKEDKDVLKGLKVAIPQEFIDNSPANKKLVEEFEKAVKVFENNGADVEVISMPNLKYAVEVYHLIMTCEVSSGMARYDGIAFGHRAEDYDSLDELYKNSRTEGFGPEVKERIMAGTYGLRGGNSDKTYEKASKVRRLIKEAFDQVFESHDVVLSLTSPVLPYKLDSMVNDPIEMHKADLHTVPANLAGLCGMSVPIGDIDGLPVGMQIISDRFKEKNLIRAGLGYERAVL